MKSYKHIALVAAFLAAAPAAVAGQDHEAKKGEHPSAPASFCFNGARKWECSTFVVAEMQGTTPADTSRPGRCAGGPTRATRRAKKAPSVSVCSGSSG